jgi:hypothetical protein
MKSPIKILDDLMSRLAQEELELPAGEDTSPLAEGWNILSCARDYLKGLSSGITIYSSVKGAIERGFVS